MLMDRSRHCRFLSLTAHHPRLIDFSAQRWRFVEAALARQLGRAAGEGLARDFVECPHVSVKIRKPLKIEPGGRSGTVSGSFPSSVGFPAWVILEVEIVHLQPVSPRRIAADLESARQSDAEDHPHASLDAPLHIGYHLRTWRRLVVRVQPEICNRQINDEGSVGHLCSDLAPAV